MLCMNCHETHTDWTKLGETAVDDGWHARHHEQIECGRCGAITEETRR